MSFGLFPEYDEPECRNRNVSHHTHERRETREHEHRNIRDIAGDVIVGAVTIGFLGGMMRR
jgi:hypothetical protein